jgi:hypothetical protein
MDVYVCMGMDIYIMRVFMCTCMYMYMYMYTYSVYVYIYVCVCVYRYMCMYMYMYRMSSAAWQATLLMQGSEYRTSAECAYTYFPFAWLA